MVRLAVGFFCCLLFVLGGCRAKSTPRKAAPDASPGSRVGYREQQKRLFSEMDAKLVHGDCQELLRLHGQGKLSTSAYFCDDPNAKLNELPPSIRSLQPTYVEVAQLFVKIAFLNEGRIQTLSCGPAGFAPPTPEPPGEGVRRNGTTEPLSGTEALDYLNDRFVCFHRHFAPNLIYSTTPPEHRRTLEEIRAQVLRDSRRSDETEAFTRRKFLEDLAANQQRLLHQTDHRELLEACRACIQRFNEGIISTARIVILGQEVKETLQRTSGYQEPPDLKHIPPIILNLKPFCLEFEKSRMIIPVSGGASRAGVIAYLNDQEAVPRDDDMELIPGLRYYDDGIREIGGDYKRYLQSLRSEAIPYREWRAKQTNPPDQEK